jgi:5-methylcytosine-specific restriction endonuclease McrA
LYCNKKFVPDKRHPQARFCEEACNKAYNFQHKYKKNKFNWYTKKYCRNCGNLIILNQSNRLNTQLIRKYCCKKCRNSAAHKRFKHFNRKGYKEKIKRRKSTQKYKELHRIEVKIRKADIKANTEHEFKPIDWLHKRNEHNGFCALCKKYVGGDKLQMDHIFPLAEAKKYFKRTGKKWTYTLAGVQPLCGSCNNKKSDNLV